MGPRELPLTDDEQALAAALDRFVEGTLAPTIDRHVRDHSFPETIVREFLSLGFMGAAFDEDNGGAGLGVRGGALVVERLARCDPGFAAIVLCNSASMSVLARFANGDQKARFLSPLITGEMISSFGVSEPQGGSDPSATRTRAERRGTDFVINGAKVFSTNAGTELHGLSLVLAQTDAAAGPRGLSTFVVPKGTPGFTIARPRDKIGWRVAPTVELFFDDVRVPADHLVGKPGDGLKQVLVALAAGRVLVAACALGLTRKALETAGRYAGARELRGKAVLSNQSVGFRLADLGARLLSASLLTRHAAELLDAGLPARAEASAAKLIASEMAVDAALAAIHLHGAYGIFEEHEASRLIGEAKVLEIAEGVSEVQRLLLLREWYGVAA